MHSVPSPTKTSIYCIQVRANKWKSMVFLCCFWLWLSPSCICFLVTQCPITWAAAGHQPLDNLGIASQAAEVGVSGVLAALTSFMPAGAVVNPLLITRISSGSFGCFSDEMAIMCYRVTPADWEHVPWLTDGILQVPALLVCPGSFHLV